VRHLANDISLQKRLQEEIDRVVGPDRAVNLNDLEKLPLLDACVLEQMRLWPVAPLTLIHVATEDITLRGYKIPKGVRRQSLHLAPRS
jgi:cytochrome P450